MIRCVETNSMRTIDAFDSMRMLLMNVDPRIMKIWSNFHLNVLVALVIVEKDLLAKMRLELVVDEMEIVDVYVHSMYCNVR